MSVDLVLWFGWPVAALGFGMWWGERGRRIDAQRREGVLPIGRIPRATVLPPGGATPAPTEAELVPPEKFIRETMEETGCSREQAEAEWHALLGQVHTDRQTGWDPIP